MLSRNFMKLTLLLAASVSLYAEDIVVYDNWLNNSFQASKNSIMGGATTATAKGYSALVANPAGLSSNSNSTVYVRTTNVEKTNNDNQIFKIYSPEDSYAAGALYNSLAIEVRPNDYVLLGAGYGYETKYGLFSVGLSYMLEQTDLTQSDETVLSDKEFVDGNYYTLGLMWQKSFVDKDDFYAIYLGLSTKASALYKGSKREDLKIEYMSPKRTSYGIGIETNIFDTSLLLTTDIFSESGISQSTSGVSHGVKLMLGDKLAIAAGISNQTFNSGNTVSSSSLETVQWKDFQMSGAGVEIGFLGIHLNVSATHRVANASLEINNLVEDAIHVDVALTF